MHREDIWGDLEHAPDIREKVRVFEQMIPSDVGTIVDVGCGDGAITNALGRRWTLTGVDSSPAALQHVTVGSVRADARSLPFADREFDMAMSSQMLEHLDDEAYRLAVAELRRVARSHLLISVPYREDLGMRIVRCPRCGHRQHVWGHVRRFTINSLLRDLEGFEAVDIRIFGDLQDPPWPRPLLALIHRLFGGHYMTTGQHPQCERCGHDDFEATRGFPPHSDRVKAWVDRVRRQPRMPYWVAVLATRR